MPLLIGAIYYLNIIFYRVLVSKLDLTLNVDCKNICNKDEKKDCCGDWENSLMLKTYLAGLWEGVGHIELKTLKKNIKSHKEVSNEINFVKKVLLAITFNIKDLPLCEHLKKLINEGRIRIKKKENACVLIFSTDKSVIKFVKLVNGHLRTPKIYKFNIVIDYLNKKYMLSIPKFETDVSNLSSNSWLAGFADADAGFNIRYTVNKKFRIACEFRIEQRMIDPFSDLSYGSSFLNIAKFLGSKLEVTQHNKDKNYYLVRGNNRKSLVIILNYFNKYNLFSSKYLDYKNWEKTALLLLANKAYLKENKDIIFDLKNNMNNKRTLFDWDHLNNLK